jgi:inner membrane protein
VDFATHALLSFALARAFFPRSGWPVFLATLAGGTLADADSFSIFFGPAAYLFAHHTFTHSLPGTVIIVVVSVILSFFARRRAPLAYSTLLLAASFSAIVHLFFDLCQSDAITVLWPFRSTRVAADYLSSADVWILGVLLAGTLLPELFRLVSSEIGAKDETPRGRTAAIVVLAMLLVYVGVHAIFHQRAISTLEAHTYHGESSRHSAAFPDSLSLFRWHGLVETSSAICQIEIPLGPQQRFDPEALTCLHKPEPSQELTAAVGTSVARKLLQASRFPRAVVQKTIGRENADKYEVTIRSLADPAAGLADHSVAAQVILDSNARILDQELVWARYLQVR